MDSSKNKKPVILKFSNKKGKLNKFIVGISSSTKIHRVAWELNKNQNINLSKAEDYVSVGSNNVAFSVYNATIDDETSIILIENKTDGGLLSSKYSNLDYFIAFTTENSHEEMEALAKVIKSNTLITGAFIIEPCKKILIAINTFLGC